MARPDSPSDPPLRTAQLPEGPVAHTDEGAGSVILAVHGMPGSHRDWRWVGAALSDRARLIRLDLPGFGGTPTRTSPAVDVRERARFVVDVADALELDRFCVIGHSIGGPLALAVAALFPDRVTGLGLLASVGLTPHRAFRRMGPLPKLAPWLDRPLTGRALMPLLRRAMGQWGFRGYADDALRQTMRCVNAVDFAVHRELASRVRVPTLTATTADDPLIEPAIGRALAAALPAGPALTFASGKHFVQKPHAVEIAEALLEMLPPS